MAQDWIAVARCGCLMSVAIADHLEDDPHEMADFLNRAKRMNRTVSRVEHEEYVSNYADGFMKDCEHDPKWGIDVENDQYYGCSGCSGIIPVLKNRRLKKHRNWRKDVCPGSGLNWNELQELRAS